MYGWVVFVRTPRSPNLEPNVFHQQPASGAMYLNLLWLIVPPGKQNLKVYGGSQLHTRTFGQWIYHNSV